MWIPTIMLLIVWLLYCWLCSSSVFHLYAYSNSSGSTFSPYTILMILSAALLSQPKFRSTIHLDFLSRVFASRRFSFISAMPTESFRAQHHFLSALTVSHWRLRNLVVGLVSWGNVVLFKVTIDSLNTYFRIGVECAITIQSRHWRAECGVKCEGGGES